MGRLIYKKWVKISLLVIQTLAAGLLVFCLLNIGFWTGGSYSIREMAKGYEESDIFFRQVDTILQQKIQGQQNQKLFETDGEFDGTKTVDIHAYGTRNSSLKDMNTTYLISDLISFAESGQQKELSSAIAAAKELQQTGGRVAGELLDEQSEYLEAIRPVTGISLAECSRWYSSPADFVLEMYQKLDNVSSDIYDRYHRYRNVQDESWLSGAPGNLKYCIEDTATGELYTNTDKTKYEEAVASIVEDPVYTSLYEGERSFNIMIANPDHVLSQNVADWFMNERFVNTNERVFLAVDMTYPVSDGLQAYWKSYSDRESLMLWNVITAVICLLVVAAGFVLLAIGAGWREGYVTVQAMFPDHIPTELCLGIYMILGVLYVLFFSAITIPLGVMGANRRGFVAFTAASAYFFLVSACLSLIRRVRLKTLWSNSIAKTMIYTWKKVTTSRAASRQLVFYFLLFIVFSFLFRLLGHVGFFLMIVLDLVVLMYLLRDMMGKQSVYDGIHQISKGDLKYKIDTQALQGESYEMAKAVNDMGDGLQEAVDAIIKNERLKAELITNVSHDIKTPLTSIVNYVDLLKRENFQDERVRHYIEILDQKSQRLKQLTEDLVEASKITSGNIELQMMKMQLQSMLQQAYGEFQERLEEHELITVWSVDKEPIYIMADGRQLWRILENLFGNIYKYAMEGTRVYIDLHMEDRTAYLTIQNTSREKLTVEGQELTGRFVRGDKSRTTEGSGLGLSIAQSLTQLHGGTFEIVTEEDNFKAMLTFPVLWEEE